MEKYVGLDVSMEETSVCVYSPRDCAQGAWAAGEEILFRGFLFRGWRRSRRDVWFVVILTALLWAVVHLQYDPYVIAQVFAYGLVLGWIRWVTGLNDPDHAAARA